MRSYKLGVFGLLLTGLVLLIGLDAVMRHAWTMKKRRSRPRHRKTPTRYS